MATTLTVTCDGCKAEAAIVAPPAAYQELPPSWVKLLVTVDHAAVECHLCPQCVLALSPTQPIEMAIKSAAATARERARQMRHGPIGVW